MPPRHIISLYTSARPSHRAMPRGAEIPPPLPTTDQLCPTSYRSYRIFRCTIPLPLRLHLIRVAGVLSSSLPHWTVSPRCSMRRAYPAVLRHSRGSTRKPGSDIPAFWWFGNCSPRNTVGESWMWKCFPYGVYAMSAGTLPARAGGEYRYRSSRCPAASRARPAQNNIAAERLASLLFTDPCFRVFTPDGSPGRQSPPAEAVLRRHR